MVNSNSSPDPAPTASGTTAAASPIAGADGPSPSGGGGTSRLYVEPSELDSAGRSLVDAGAAFSTALAPLFARIQAIEALRPAGNDAPGKAFHNGPSGYDAQAEAFRTSSGGVGDVYATYGNAARAAAKTYRDADNAAAFGASHVDLGSGKLDAIAKSGSGGPAGSTASSAEPPAEDSGGAS